MSESGCPGLKDEQDEDRNFITYYHIYEWKESAIAISSPELAAAFKDEAKKQNLG